VKRPALAELTESVGDVVSTGVSTIGDLAGAAASRTGDLASSAIDHASSAFDKVSDQVGDVSGRVGHAARERLAPAPKRSKTPWVLLVLAAAAGAGLFWWMRRDNGSGDNYSAGATSGSVLPSRPGRAAAGGQSDEPSNPAAY